MEWNIRGESRSQGIISLPYPLKQQQQQQQSSSNMKVLVMCHTRTAYNCVIAIMRERLFKRRRAEGTAGAGVPPIQSIVVSSSSSATLSSRNPGRLVHTINQVLFLSFFTSFFFVIVFNQRSYRVKRKSPPSSSSSS
jgi:hypothetical protein